MSGIAVAIAMSGIIAGQICLLAIWPVLGPGTLVQQRGLEFAVGALWLVFWTVGYLASDVISGGHTSSSTRDGWLVLLLPAIYAGMQTPLWIMGGFFRWRLEHGAMDPRRRPFRRLSLADLLITTAIVAMALAAVRIAFYMHGKGPDSDSWIGLGAFILIAAGISLASTLPALTLVLAMRRVGVGLAILGSYAAVALTMTIIVSTEMLYITVSSTVITFRISEVVFVCVPFFAGLFVALVGPLCLARALGYRLSWDRPERGR